MNFYIRCAIIIKAHYTLISINGAVCVLPLGKKVALIVTHFLFNRRRKKESNNMSSKFKMSSVLISMCFLFCSCSNSSNDDTEKEALKSQVEALQSQVEQISTSEEKSVENDTDNSNAKDEGYWVIRSFTDKFGDSTNDKYITNNDYIEGTFSNSATTNSKLNVVLAIEKGSTKGKITISLYEYGDQLVKNSNSYSKNDNNYAVFFKTGSTEWLCKGIMTAGNDRIVIDSESDDHDYLLGYDILDIGSYLCIDKLDKFLKASQDDTIKVYIEEVENPITNYSFSIKTDNYAEMYNELNNIKTS